MHQVVIWPPLWWKEDRETDAKGVVLNVRYAIILNLKVTDKRRFTRIKGDFNQIEVFELNGQQVLQGQFNSLAAKDYFLESVAYLRNSDKKLVAKINLKSQSAWQRNDPKSRIFPGAKVNVNAPFKQILSAGIYDVVVKNRFGDRLQKTFKTEIKTGVDKGSKWKQALPVKRTVDCICRYWPVCEMLAIRDRRYRQRQNCAWLDKRKALPLAAILR